MRYKGKRRIKPGNARTCLVYFPKHRRQKLNTSTFILLRCKTRYLIIMKLGVKELTIPTTLLALALLGHYRPQCG
jgi:hypothetical protein